MVTCSLCANSLMFYQIINNVKVMIRIISKVRVSFWVDVRVREFDLDEVES